MKEKLEAKNLEEARLKANLNYEKKLKAEDLEKDRLKKEDAVLDAMCRADGLTWEQYRKKQEELAALVQRLFPHGIPS